MPRETVLLFSDTGLKVVEIRRWYQGRELPRRYQVRGEGMPAETFDSYLTAGARWQAIYKANQAEGAQG